MGYAKSAIKTIPLADPAYEVTINKILTVGRGRGYRAELAEITAKDPEGKDPNSAMDRTEVILFYAIVDWNLDDDDGVKIPVTRENMSVVDMEDSRIIIA